MEGNGKRRAGRPRAIPQTGPLVLEGGRARVKVDLEIGERTVEELKAYARWVEQSSAVEGKDALFKTVDFALRDLFRRDRLWQEQRKRHDHGESPSAPQAPPTPAATSPLLPPPSPSPRPVLAIPVTAPTAVRR